jgi:hypothetical protein
VHEIAHCTTHSNNNSVALVRERTILTELPLLVGEVSANFYGLRVPRGQRDGSLLPYSRISRRPNYLLLIYFCIKYFVHEKFSSDFCFWLLSTNRQVSLHRFAISKAYIVLSSSSEELILKLPYEPQLSTKIWYLTISNYFVLASKKKSVGQTSCLLWCSGF